MKDTERRLKEEYGGMIVNTRKVGEAIMVSTDIAIMPVRVIGQQVRLGVVSKSGLPVFREETFRKMVEAKLSEGPSSFTKLYRNMAKAGIVAYYSLRPSDVLESAELDCPDQFSDVDDPVTIVKYGTKYEAIACAKGVELSHADCRASVEEAGREWYVILQHFNKPAGQEDPQMCLFYDYSFPWGEMKHVELVNEDNS